MHLTGRAWVTCQDLAATDTGKGGAGILNSYSGKWALYPPRLIGRVFRSWMAQDNVKLSGVHSRGHLRQREQILQRHGKHVLILAQSNEMVTALLRVYI